MLPLLGLNRFSFSNVESNFINSYIAEDDIHLVVEMKCQVTTIISNQPTYKLKFEKNGVHYAVFEIPVFYRPDVKKFREGKYSQFSESAKATIRKKSGLRYRVPLKGGGWTSARELLALDKDKDLRKTLEKELVVQIDDDAELASIPGPENFYALNLSNQLLLTESATC